MPSSGSWTHHATWLPSFRASFHGILHPWPKNLHHLHPIPPPYWTPDISVSWISILKAQGAGIQQLICIQQPMYHTCCWFYRWPSELTRAARGSTLICISGPRPLDPFHFIPPFLLILSALKYANQKIGNHGVVSTARQRWWWWWNSYWHKRSFLANDLS